MKFRNHNIAGRAAMRAVTLAVVVAGLAQPSQAIAPPLLLFIKQIAQQAARSMFKDALLSSLSGMGCKGIALSNALNAFDRRGGTGGAGGMLAGMPKMPGGVALPNPPPGMSLLGMPNLPPGAGMPPDMAAKLTALMPGAGQLPPGMAMEPEQMAMMARLQQAMAQPLSPPETLATIDELFELGFLPKAMQAELKECMVLVPATIPALGMGMGMLKPMIPQLHRARDELRALPPAEQDEVAAALAQEMSTLAVEERAALVEHLDLGFFPPRVAEGVKARLAARPVK